MKCVNPYCKNEVYQGKAIHKYCKQCLEESDSLEYDRNEIFDNKYNDLFWDDADIDKGIDK